MSEVPNFKSPEDILSWLKQFGSKCASDKLERSQTTDAPTAEDAKATKRQGKRKKIRAGELLSIAKDSLEMLARSYKQINIDDFFNPITLDSHRRRLGPGSIEEQIEEASTQARSDVLRFMLDIIDYFTAGITIPRVKTSVVFWARKAISAFIDNNPNIKPEAAPWKEFPRNVIAAGMIQAIEDSWFTGGFHMHKFSSEEATRIFEADNSIYSGFQASAWGY